MTFAKAGSLLEALNVKSQAARQLSSSALYLGMNFSKLANWVTVETILVAVL